MGCRHRRHPTRTFAEPGAEPMNNDDAYRYREVIAAWLRANDIDPSDVPIDSPIKVAPKGDGKVIRYETFIRTSAGRFPSALVREQHEAPLVIDLGTFFEQTLEPTP
jgi:hypothetical protein